MVYFDGGPGVDTMNRRRGRQQYAFDGMADPGGTAMDLITNFDVAVDLIDFTGFGGSPVSAAALVPNATTISARSIGWLTSGGNTFVCQPPRHRGGIGRGRSDDRTARRRFPVQCQFHSNVKGSERGPVLLVL